MANMERKGQILNIVLEIFLVLLLITAAVLILPAWHNYRKMRAEELRQRGKLEYLHSPSRRRPQGIDRRAEGGLSCPRRRQTRLLPGQHHCYPAGDFGLFPGIMDGYALFCGFDTLFW